MGTVRLTLNKLSISYRRLVRIFFQLSVVLFITSCVSAPGMHVIDKLANDANPPARLRIYGKNGIFAKFFPGKACYPKVFAGGTLASGSFLQSLASSLRFAKNQRIGIAETTRSSSSITDFYGKEFFSEFVIAADQPVTVAFAFRNNLLYCPTTWHYFVPFAGKDYEMFLTFDGAEPQRCQITLHEISMENNEVQALSHPLTKAPMCDNDALHSPAEMSPLQN